MLSSSKAEVVLSSLIHTKQIAFFVLAIQDSTFLLSRGGEIPLFTNNESVILRDRTCLTSTNHKFTPEPETNR